jgi:tol-pal system protein YbgF
MKRYLFFSIAALLAALLATGCASSGPKKEEVDRVAILEQQFERLLTDLNDLQVDTRSNADAIEQLRAEIKTGMDELRTEGTKSAVRLDTLQAKLEALTERIEDSELRISALRRDVASSRAGRPGSYYARPTDPSADPDAPESQAPATDIGPLPNTDAEAYRKAYDDYLKGDYSAAAAGFRAYLRAWSAGAKVEDARYFLAESLYNQGEYEDAVTEYDVLIVRHPRSPYVISATYKKGLSFLDSNQTAQGVILLQQLISRYPDSNEARLAREKLRNLGLNP